MPELLGMCDRIYVMSEGKFVGELDGKEATQEKIMAMIINSDNSPKLVDDEPASEENKEEKKGEK